MMKHRDLSWVYPSIGLLHWIVWELVVVVYGAHDLAVARRAGSEMRLHDAQIEFIGGALIGFPLSVLWPVTLFIEILYGLLWWWTTP